MSSITAVSAKNLRVEVEYYDNAEKTRLLQYPTANKIADAIANGIAVSPAQLLTYFFYHRRRPGRAGYTDYRDIQRTIVPAFAAFEDWVDLQNGTVRLIGPAQDAIHEVTEHLGEAIALSVAGHIHGLHEADWDRIPEHPGRGGFPSFDFERDELSASVVSGN